MSDADGRAAYQADLDGLVAEWTRRAERVSATIGAEISSTRVPAVVVDYR